MTMRVPEEYLKKSKTHKKLNLIGGTDVETKILQAIHEGARSGEEIMQVASLPPEVFNEATTLLEIKGRIMALGMNNWALT